ncbi:HD-GYP domain-containing protein [Paenibacillus typhae]|uniref:HD-GYP domain, c-di-GMP phosphodiesterase class II (Or its inactivated variant) n=1 Tax=Paenibacillus typhae TaxID=1174501 RepID=A0A1G8R8X4_9BACL|nr:HD domain-containing phosphohydrolase [Paenibacillus typhae]SDJ13323.1 HD-GYP domain, c-di-GMP phosphodiesterase class II (or its inactivated variant) [Paenibacillus typhae]
MSLEAYDIFIGKKLDSNIYSTDGILLISKDTVLHQNHIDKLANFRIKLRIVEEAVEETGEDGQKRPEAADTAAEARLRPSSIESRRLAKRTEKHLQEIDRLVRANGIVPIDDVEEKILPFIKDTAKRFNLFQVFSELKEQEDYRYKQSIGVAVIATSLGRRLGLDDEEMELLATAACVYDIGLVRLPSSLIAKPGRLDKHEFEIMKQHTVLGYELLSNSGVDPRIALVALQHHEREDGSGYPHGIKGDQIDRLSKIVTLADIYMAMISDRPHRPAVEFFEVINNIHEGIIHNRFDSYIGMTFLDSLLASQVGCEVHLSDGRTGTIVLTNSNYPTRPLIALAQNEFLDLSKTSLVHIRDVIG